jgi:methylamine dehydrogenase accessory protein MauD
METAWLLSNLVLWAVVLFLAFLLLGALRALALLRWRLEQLEATTPSHVGRSGLKPGKRAPDFTLPCVGGGEVSLHNLTGRPVFLVFTQSGCKPCHRVVPHLNRLHDAGEVQVLVINNGELEASRQWAAETKARFPVLVQERFAIAKRYEMFATPFAFLIERGVIVFSGIINTGEHIGFVLSRALAEARDEPGNNETTGTGSGVPAVASSQSHSKEVEHA